MKITLILKKNLLLSVLLILTVPAFYTLLRPGFFPMQDDLQAFRIHQMDTCFKNFQIPCRWVPDAGYQYGYPQFNYYPPSVYYLGEIIHLLGFQFIDAVKILFILGFVLSAITMYIFLKSWLDKWAAVVGSLLYVYAPYKAVDVYVRGALSEFWAFVFFPLIFWSIYQLIKTEKMRYLPWVGLSIGLLLITHSLMSMIFLPLAVLWGIIWIVLEKKWRVLPTVMAGGMLGLMFGAFFVFPAILEKQFSHSESMLGGYFDYRQHFVNIYRLFISNHWGYGSSGLNQDNDLSLSTGQIQWIIGFLAFIPAIILRNKYPKFLIVTVLLIGMDLATLFMVHQKSSFIWSKIFILSWLQFPWRFLAVGVFLLSILGAITVFLVSKQEMLIRLEKKRINIAYIFGSLIITGLLILYGGFFQPKSWMNISDKEKFSGELWEKQLTISIFDYLPIYAKLPPVTKAPVFPEILSGQVNFIDYQKGGNFQKGSVEVVEDSEVRLPLFDFPGMRVRVDEKMVEHRHDNCQGQEFCLGLISFQIPAGNHTIEARLTNTPIRSTSNIISGIGILVIGLLFWRYRKV